MKFGIIKIFFLPYIFFLFIILPVKSQDLLRLVNKDRLLLTDWFFEDYYAILNFQFNSVSGIKPPINSTSEMAP